MLIVTSPGQLAPGVINPLRPKYLAYVGRVLIS